MPNDVVVLFVFFLLVEPLLVLAHELGHASVIVANGNVPHVTLGGERGRTVDLGLLTLSVRPVGLLRPMTTGFCSFDSDPTREVRIFFALAGPAVTLSLLGPAFALSTAPAALVREIAAIAGLYLLLQAVFTLAPIRYPGWFGDYGGVASDGRVALALAMGWDDSPNEDVVPTPPRD